MSLAQEILRIVNDTVRSNGAVAVQEVFIDVGTLAGVMVPALEFCLEAAKGNTTAQTAVFHINEIAGRGRCPSCGQEHSMESPITNCPSCPDSYLSMTAGDDLRVREIEVTSPN